MIFGNLSDAVFIIEEIINIFSREIKEVPPSGINKKFAKKDNRIITIAEKILNRLLIQYNRCLGYSENPLLQLNPTNVNMIGNQKVDLGLSLRCIADNFWT